MISIARSGMKAQGGSGAGWMPGDLSRDSLAALRPLFVFSVFANLLMLAAPLHMMQVYDRVLVSGSLATLFYITLITVVVLCFFGIAEALRGILAQRISARFTVERTDALFAKLTDGSLTPPQADKLVHDFAAVRMFIGSRSMIGLFDLPFAPVFLLLLLALHIQVGLLAAAGMAALIALAWANRVLSAPDQKTAAEINADMVSFASAAARRGEDIRAMGLMPALGRRFGHLMMVGLGAQDLSAGSNALFLGASRALRQVLQVAIMAWGAALVLAGDMSGGAIFAASMISGRALQPVEQVIAGWDAIAKARQAHDAISSALAGSSETVAPVAQPRPSGRLKVTSLALAVSRGGNDHHIVQGVGFGLEPGEALAIIGPSGAGKSTIARMVAGASRPTDGEIRLDGCDQSNWPHDQWGRYVGYVGQEVLLFPGTVAQNIARMAEEPDESATIGAAQLAGAHDLINSLPDGYSTRIGDGGVRLSGGQAQRIALARALYSNPCLLVLDEPNAHLDAAGEAVLLETLQRLKQSGTAIVVVTQRQRILAVADKVMTVVDGRMQSIKPVARATDDAIDAAAQSRALRAMTSLNRSDMARTDTPLGTPAKG